MNAFQLLKLEYYKFKSSTVVLVMLGFFTVLTPFAILMGRKIFGGLPPPFPNVETFYEFPNVWNYQGHLGSWFIFFFLGYVSLYIVTSDVASKTMRQNIITGMTRTEYFMGKVAAVTAISLVATLIYTLSCIVLGVIYTESYGTQSLLNVGAIFRYFLMSEAYMIFGLFIGFLVRKGGLAVAIYFIYIMIVEFILKMMTGSLLLKLGLDKYINAINYYPTNVFEDLHPNPLMRIPETLKQFSNGFGGDYQLLVPHNSAILVTVIYILIFLLISYRRFMRKDM